MTSTSKISTPIPTGLAPETLIAALHDHTLYVKITNPDMISVKQDSGPSPPTIGSPCTYTVTNKNKDGESTMEQVFTNHPDGVDVSLVIKPPVGGDIVIRASWRVVDGVLKEEVDIEAGFLIRKMAKGPIEKGAVEHHKAFFVETGRA